MTFPEKMKYIRRKMSLSQESLADALGVSRQSITKWESGDGLPDTFNMKELAKLTGLSVDYLLDTAKAMPILVMTETLDKSAIMDKKGFSKNDQAVLARYSDCAIYPLTRKKKMNLMESVVDFVAGAGTVELADQFSNMATYYLIVGNEGSLLVRVQKDEMITREIGYRVHDRTLEFEGNIYRLAKMPLPKLD